MKRVLVLFMVLVFVGCAKSGTQIEPTYVSPLLYRNLECDQIIEETLRVTSNVAALTGEQNQHATRDAVATGVAIVIFWPAAFFVRGDGKTGAELAHLKGELEALELASNEKECGLVFDHSDAEKRAEMKENAQRNSAGVNQP